MKKNRKLKKIWKIIFSLVIALLDIFVYRFAGEIGDYVMNSTFYLILCLFSWFYLFFIQIVLLILIWDEELCMK